eukprot:s171_g24.t1
MRSPCSEACGGDPVQITLTGGSCIDLICSDKVGTCANLDVSNTSTDTCYYQGPDNKRPAECLAATQPMCGDIQPAGICCGGSGGCDDCCRENTTTTTTTDETTTEDLRTSSSTTSATTTSTTKKPYHGTSV